jgi:sucrose-6-phosphate hydrolase SacC (GH32 family)
MKKACLIIIVFMLNLCLAYPQSLKDLVGYWKFDEHGGKIALDMISGRADSIHYIFNNTKPLSDPIRRKGILYEALEFDGFSSWIERSASSFLTPSEQLSISVWVAPRDFESGQGGKLSAIVNQQDLKKKTGFALGMYRHGSWSFQFGTGDKWIEIWDEGNPLLRQQWSFITATYDASSGTIVLYLNGKPISEKKFFKDLPIKVADNSLLIGRHNQNETLNRGNFPLNMYNGLMDELRIYKRALSSDEVKNLYLDYLSLCDNQIPVIPYKDIMIDRSKYNDDLNRPEFHASPPGHWMNEPHAPFYYNGKYHINYQFNVTGPYWGQICWGHWVSTDMVHWKDLPESIYPENDTIAPDGIWSGSATYDKNGSPVLFYTFGNLKKAFSQGVAMAVPNNIKDSNLVKWDKYPKPTITQKSGQAMTGEFRDPFAWKDYDNDGKWYMLVGSGQRGPTVSHPEGTAWFYESDDLLSWKLKGEFYKTDFNKYPEMAGIWELPVLLPIGKYPNGERKYVFMCSPVVRGLNVRYFIGKIDKQKSCFVPDDETPQQMNYGGGGFTASSGMVDPKTGRTIVFTLSHGGTGPGWAGNMGLPIEISLDKGNDLVINPIKELESLRNKELVSLQNKNIEIANNKLKKIGGDMIEILLEIDPMNSKKYGIKVRKSPDDSEMTLVYYDKEKNHICVDGSKSKLDSRRSVNSNNLIIEGPLNLKGENLRLHIYIDKSMLEVYANSRKAITTRMYPSLRDAIGLEIFSDNEIRIKSLNVWKLKSIYY